MVLQFVFFIWSLLALPSTATLPGVILTCYLLYITGQHFMQHSPHHKQNKKTTIYSKSTSVPPDQWDWMFNASRRHLKRVNVLMWICVIHKELHFQMLSSLGEWKIKVHNKVTAMFFWTIFQSLNLSAGV